MKTNMMTVEIPEPFVEILFDIKSECDPSTTISDVIIGLYRGAWCAYNNKNLPREDIMARIVRLIHRTTPHDKRLAQALANHKQPNEP